MKDLPGITVITSVYNGARYLRFAIESILNQTLQNFEYIIVDDASTDETPNILNSFKDTRIRILRNSSNRYQYFSLDRAWKVASAPLIAVLDADDIACPHRLEKQAAYLNDHPKVGLVGCAVKVINGEGKFLKNLNFPTGHACLKARLLTNPIIHSSLMFRRSLMEKVGGYGTTERYALDFDIQCRVSEVSQFVTLPEILIEHRKGHPESVTVGKRTQQMAVGRKIATRNMLKIMNDFPSFKTRDAELFYDAIHGVNLNLRSGDIIRFGPLLNKLLGTKEWRKVWSPRLIELTSHVMIWNKIEAKALWKIIALKAPLNNPKSLLACWVGLNLGKHSPKKLRKFIHSMRNVSF